MSDDNPFSPYAAVQAAKERLKEEQFEEAVKKEVEKLRAKKPFLYWLWPWKIKFERRR